MSAAVAKTAPRFGGGGEKCKTCTKTVYPNERISYDNGTWHQLCFKCIQCRSTLSLTAVAMISGDLYCKTCFKKIFLREGRYSTFEANKGSLPKDVAAELTHAASMGTPTSEKEPSPVVSRSASVINTSTSATHSSSPSIAAASPQTPVARLQAAVEQKDFAACQALLTAHGAALLFEPVASGVSVLEWSLTSYMHKTMGGKLVEWLRGAVGETGKLLKDNGLASPLEGKEGQKVEESKESEAGAGGDASDAEVAA